MVEHAGIYEKLGYAFKDSGLLDKALTHSSYVNEKGQSRKRSNERLEFLGDSLLSLIISRFLYQHTPELSEGEMTKLRAALVCERSLFEKATEIDLGLFLRLGKGEEGGGGRSRPSILADAFEAVIAAIYLDGGIDVATGFVERCFGPLDTAVPKTKMSRDYKSLLQEYIQEKLRVSHKYRIVSQKGPDHDKTFTAEVQVDGKPQCTGTGKTKKAAEQDAAKKTLLHLKGKGIK